MTIKKIQHYTEIKKFCSIFNNSDNIVLFVHHNNLSQFETNSFSLSLLKEKKIKFFFIKLNIIKKIINNSNISPLLTGPTYICVLKNISDLNFFLQNFYLKKNIIPLSFIINKKIYNYDYIYSNFVHKKKKKQLKKLEKKNFVANFFNLNIIIFILFLKHLKKEE